MGLAHLSIYVHVHNKGTWITAGRSDQGWTDGKKERMWGELERKEKRKMRLPKNFKSEWVPDWPYFPRFKPRLSFTLNVSCHLRNYWVKSMNEDILIELIYDLVLLLISPVVTLPPQQTSGSKLWIMKSILACDFFQFTSHWQIHQKVNIWTLPLMINLPKLFSQTRCRESEPEGWQQTKKWGQMTRSRKCWYKDYEDNMKRHNDADRKTSYREICVKQELAFSIISSYVAH